MKSNQMDMNKEEGRPRPDLPSLPQERHVWRMPEFPPLSPRSVPTNFDVSSEPELIQGNILRDEPFRSGRNRSISALVQKLVQRSQGRGVGNIPKPLAGGYELLLKPQELSGSGEDHRALRKMDPILLQI
ncbi:hypothetical protein O181_026506 [Austropuccinia psidii MF-1]|uniref:Uncharacterized protein n=1 Tax=Austropuccinia psidii MF-1 TaxID=1389203 RepID=A0A9Q3H0K3_9BASI|nr:hypothetical protein [Austropuccinia psidii MF-1]